jgi:hypothetical protein
MLARHPDRPRTFYTWAVRAPSKRALWDAAMTEVLAEHGRRKPESLYGSVVKMWAPLQRSGHPGGQVHRGAAHAPPRLAGRAPGLPKQTLAG